MENRSSPVNVLASSIIMYGAGLAAGWVITILFLVFSMASASMSHITFKISGTQWSRVLPPACRSSNLNKNIWIMEPPYELIPVIDTKPIKIDGHAIYSTEEAKKLDRFYAGLERQRKIDQR
jgi:hypothetical protein